MAPPDGAFATLDAGVGPVPPGADAGAGADEGLRATSSGDSMLDPASCYGESAGEVLCDEGGCGALPSCCVGDGDCCAPVAAGPLPATLPLAVCAGGGDVQTCLAAAGVNTISFGSFRPWIDGDALHPGGSAADDGGLVLGDRVDLGSHRVAVAARFSRPGRTCGVGCIEGAALGFTEQMVEPGGENHIRPLAGLLYSGSRNDVSLLVADEVVGRWPLSGDAERWRLTVRPTGRLTVDRGEGDELVAEAIVAPARSASLVLWGRSENGPGDGVLGARVHEVSVDTGLCDMPGAWGVRRPLALGAAGVPWQPMVGGLSVAWHDGSPWLCLEVGGDLYLAEGAAPTTFDFADAGVPEIPKPTAEDATRRWAQGGLEDPALVRLVDRWVVFFTAVGDDGVQSVGRAVWIDGEAGFALDASPVLSPAAWGLLHLDQPAVAVHSSGELALVARATDAEGESLFVFRDHRVDSWTRLESSDLPTLTSRVNAPLSAFDADQIARPSLFVHDGAWQLAYAGRRGTRWSIGLMVSDDLLHWRRMGAMLSRGQQSWNRVGVSAPAILSRPALDRVELYHLGTDGARRTPGFTARDAGDLYGAP